MLPHPVSFISLTSASGRGEQALTLRRHPGVRSQMPAHTWERVSAQGCRVSLHRTVMKRGRIGKGLRNEMCNKTKIWFQVLSVPNISFCREDLQFAARIPSALSASRGKQKHWLSFKIEAPPRGDNFCLLWWVWFGFCGGRWCCRDLSDSNMLSLCDWHCYF